MAELENFYNEHATQARQHEDHRERMTNIILSIDGVLVGLITFSQLSIWSIFPSACIIILGFYGFLFAGKHYERFKFHTSIMGAIRNEIDQLYLNPQKEKRSLASLRDEGSSNHFRKFTWPTLIRKKKSDNQDTEKKESNVPETPTIVTQGQATSWIARQGAHVFWETIHLLMILIGFGLMTAISIKNIHTTPDKPLQIEIVTTK